MYKIFMLIALSLLAAAWIAYALWMRKVREEEEKTGRPVSQHLQKTRSEVVDWAQKMAKFEPPTRKKTEDRKQNTEDREQKTEDREQMQAEQTKPEKD